MHVYIYILNMKLVIIYIYNINFRFYITNLAYSNILNIIYYIYVFTPKSIY